MRATTARSYLATASADTTIKLWKVEELVPGKRPEPYKVLSGHTRWVWDCVFSADSAYMVSGTCYPALTLTHARYRTRREPGVPGDVERRFFKPWV